MNRTIRAIIGAVLVLVIVFSAISICQNIGKSLKADITQQKIYTLSDGTKAILAKLHQKITVKLYYAKTAAIKGPDQIQYFNNYYYFVRALLEEYLAQAKGNVVLEVIDPRPYSEDEVEALRLGLRRFAITEEENFFFGLVVQTPFGVERVIPFFSPERQRFVEYDISYLIDTAITRTKKKIGILSSLPVMGEDVSGYMAQMMRMQGQRPKPPCSSNSCVSATKSRKSPRTSTRSSMLTSCWLFIPRTCRSRLCLLSTSLCLRAAERLSVLTLIALRMRPVECHRNRECLKNRAPI